MTIGKETAQGICFMKTTAQFLGSNIKIVPDDNAIKLGCCDRCGLLLNTYRKGYQSKLLVVHSKGEIALMS